MAHPVKVRTAEGWQDLALVGETGPPGPTGPQGPQGATGLAEVWYSGSGVPSGVLGVVGDWYLDVASGDVHEKTGASTWTLRANIRGPQGTAGATGSQGPIGNTGATGPTGPTGDSGVVAIYEQPGDPGAVEEGSLWIDTDTPPPVVAAPEVTVSTSAPVGAPVRDGILWVVVEP